MPRDIKTNEEKMETLFSLTGKLISNASTCDAVLFSVFCVISECRKEVAQAIYYATESAPAKVNLVRRTLKVSNYKAQTEIIERVITANQKVHKKRNELSHILLRVVDENEVVIQNPRNQEQSIKRITTRYLNNLFKEASYPSVECLKAAKEFSEATGEKCPINL